MPVIRLAATQDIDAVTALVHAAYHKWVAVINRQPAPMEADYADLLGRQVVYVAEEAGQIIGVLVIWPIEDAMLIENIAVLPDSQRGGVGKILMAFAEQQARAIGLPQMALYTHEKMISNQHYYRKLGYEETRREAYAVDRHIVWMYKPL